MYLQANRVSKQSPTLPDRQVTGDPHRGWIDWPALSSGDFTDVESESRRPLVRQRLGDVSRPAPPGRILPFPTGTSTPEVVFGISSDEMRRLLAEDEEEDRAVLEQMFEASFLRGTPDASEDD